MHRSVITGTGSYIPTVVKRNDEFISQKFYTEDHAAIKIEPHLLIDKFQKITGIDERRYVTTDLNASDIAALAAESAIINSQVDAETIDLLIVAQNFGDVSVSSTQTDSVPALASRVKNKLRIKNPLCVAFDILFGCPGWIQGVIQAEAFFKAGMAKKALVIGTETLSRVIDVHDRDSMIFSDGAGAIVMEYREVTSSGAGILSSSALSYCEEETYFINMNKSYYAADNSNTRYMKMAGRKVYEFALKHVPQAMKACLDKAGADIADLKQIFIHQANEKMDEAIVQAMYRLYGYEKAPGNIMPMSIHYLGNSSVATVPTLYDLVLQGRVPGYSVQRGDVVLFASVGAGMNINAVCYRV
jgi:3-oxoacyl-[acyl-carrier-protein] synthase-3